MGEKFEEAKDRVKKAIGDLTGNEEMVSEANLDELATKAKGAVQNAAEATQKGIDALKDKLS